MGRIIRIGCAGWAIPRELKGWFPPGESILERYARIFPATEINTTFYRTHEPATFERWAAATGAGFRFSVKAPREITHFRRLAGARAPLERFLAGVTRLGRKLGPILIQLPPSLAFDRRRAGRFFRLLRDLHGGPVVCEPRHPSWFVPEAEDLLEGFQVGRAAADPACVERASRPGGWKKLVYYRLHGSPVMYRSAYSSGYLRSLAADLKAPPRSASVWCIFDNTAAGAATSDALSLLRMVRKAGVARRPPDRRGVGGAAAGGLL